MMINKNFSCLWHHLFCLVLTFFISLSSLLAKDLMPVGNQQQQRITKRAALTCGLGYDPVIVTDKDMIVFESKVGEEQMQIYYVGGSGFTPFQPISLILELEGSSLFSISDDGNFSNSITINVTPNDNGSFEERMVWVKYLTQEQGVHTATITHSVTMEGSTVTKLVNVATSVPLPVELLSFEGKAQMESIQLNWTTVSEKNNSHFEVEISKDPAAGFDVLGTVASKMVNSIVATQYSFEHHMEGAAGTYFFRLKQVDTDNLATTYSKLIAIQMSAEAETIVKMEPNPVSTDSQLYIATNEAGKLNVVIFQMDGTLLYNQSFNIPGGESKIDLDVNDQLTSGMYILNTVFNGQPKRLKIIKN